MEPYAPLPVRLMAGGFGGEKVEHMRERNFNWTRIALEKRMHGAAPGDAKAEACPWARGRRCSSGVIHASCAATLKVGRNITLALWVGRSLSTLRGKTLGPTLAPRSRIK